ncbi:MAG: alcohol dehydrogenase, partial [Eubacterium sp.]|nr:alcohol dehydrogenase [Eubacterium sp.]
HAAHTADDDKTAAEAFLNACKELCNLVAVPTLENFGGEKERAFEVRDKMAEDALASGSPANTIKKVNKKDILKIYKNLWKKQ